MKQSFLSNESFIFICLCLSVFRIYLEVIGFNFEKLPLTKQIGINSKKFHRYGFYICVGHVLLFAPQILFKN